MVMGTTMAEISTFMVMLSKLCPLKSLSALFFITYPVSVLPVDNFSSFWLKNYWFFFGLDSKDVLIKCEENKPFTVKCHAAICIELVFGLLAASSQCPFLRFLHIIFISNDSTYTINVIWACNQRMTRFVMFEFYISNHELPVNQLNFEVPDFTVFLFWVSILKPKPKKYLNEGSRKYLNFS